MRKWIAIPLIGLPLLALVAVGLARPYDVGVIDAHIAAEKAAGRPVTVEDLTGPAPPPETNGAGDLDSALHWMTEHHGDPDSWTVPGPWSATWSERWYDDESPERLRALDAFFDASKPFFDGVAACVAKPRMLLPSRTDANGYVEFDDVESMQDVVRLLQARSLADPDARDRLQAMSVLAALSVRHEAKTLIGFMVDAVAMGAATFALRRDLERGQLDVTAAREALSESLSVPWLPRVSSSMRLVRADLLQMGRTAAIDPTTIVSGATPEQRIRNALIDRVKARIDALVNGREVVRASPEDFVAAHTALAAFESLPVDSYPRLDAELRAKIAALPADSIAATFSVWLPRTAEQFARVDAGTRLARIALAAAEHRVKHGDFPASLDDLRAAFPDGVPLDPYTDRPFEYARTEAGVRIASAGRLDGAAALDDAELRKRCLVWELKR